jgi:hypothetical protein
VVVAVVLVFWVKALADQGAQTHHQAPLNLLAARMAAALAVTTTLLLVLRAQLGLFGALVGHSLLLTQVTYDEFIYPS